MTDPSGDPDKTLRLDSDARAVRRTSGSDPQFTPGTMVAGRYRIAGILGKGGMGEVYRAEDTRLGQSVALKFLPARLAGDPMLLDRLHEEVRLGRQIAHPNVCRIYDIGDFDGVHFLAMEYIDGEDLSRLLMRIGRLAHDKAVDIARGIGAGLAAAHGKSILHRDLKPQNVMIDSRGEARVMDFGLALDADDDDGRISGTPAYMAPEQLAGAPASVQSDLYAYGLVMYELFTGKPVHRGRTMPERLRDSSSEIATPSSLIRDLDPAIEKIILRCLATDPALRPRSAREVVIALPGGDPLQAALAAGETPSPLAVAAAGSVGALRLPGAWSLLIFVLLTLAVVVAGKRRFGVSQWISLEKPAEVLQERAMTTLRTLGIPVRRYVEYDHRTREEYLAWILTDRTPGKWERLREGPPLITFQHVEGGAPQPVESVGDIVMRPGTTRAEVDMQGRLFELTVLPGGQWPLRPIDWTPLLVSAGLDPGALSSATPRLVPPGPFDAHVAWSGKYRDLRTPNHVEAAAWRGTPVFLRITGPWETASPETIPFGARRGQVFAAVLVCGVLAIGAFLAWRNLRLRRGDRAGAFRIAVVFFTIDLAAQLLLGRHQPLWLHELELLKEALADALLWSGAIYLFYMALEPFVRRRWPEQLIASTRLVNGSYDDPMVGRDVLIGILTGVVHTGLIVAAEWVSTVADGFSQGSPLYGDALAPLSGMRFGVGTVAASFSAGAFQGFLLIVLLVGLNLLLRRRLLAAIGLGCVFLAGYSALAGLSPWNIAMTCMIVFVAARYGLLSAAVAQATFHCTFHYPMFRGAAWHSIDPLPLIIVMIVTLWAFRTSLGSQSAFSGGLLDDE